MKIEAKVKGAVVGKPDDICSVNVDEDYVESDPDIVRAYIIDELYIMLANEPCEINEAGLEVLNMDDIVSEIVQLSSEDPV